MKTIKLDFEFMQAMHTFDIVQVRRTPKYREMLAASGARQKDLDTALMSGIEKIKEKFANDPAGSEAIMRTMKYFAQEEKRK